MATKVILQKITDVARDDEGRAYAWRGAGIIAKFETADEAIDYIDEHIGELDRNVNFFTGSASLLMSLNEYLKQQLDIAYGEVEDKNLLGDLDNVRVPDIETGKRMVAELNRRARETVSKMQLAAGDNEEHNRLSDEHWSIIKARRSVQSQVQTIFKLNRRTNK